MDDFVDYYAEYELNSTDSWEVIHKELQDRLTPMLKRGGNGNNAVQSKVENLEQALKCFESAEAKARYDAALAQANRTEEDELLDAIASVQHWAAQPGEMRQAEHEMDHNVKKLIERIGQDNVSCNTLCKWGLALLTIGRADEAEVAARDVRTRDPRFPGAYYLLGNVAESRGDLQTAKREWSNALEYERAGDYGNLYLARCVAALARISLDENAVDVEQLRRADVRKQYRSFLSDLKANLDEALAVDPASEEAKQVAERVAGEFEKADKGQVQEAVGSINKCLAKFEAVKRSDAALLHSAERRQYADELRSLAKDVDAARLSLKQLGKRLPEGDDLAKRIESELTRIGDANSSIATKRERLAACADEIDALLQAGDVAAAQNLMRSEVMPITRGIGSHNVASGLMLRFAHAALSMRLLDEARSFARQLLDRGESLGEAQLIMGQVCRSEGDFENAMGWYDKASQSSDATILVQAIRGRAYCLLNLGRPSDAQLGSLDECFAYGQKLNEVEGLLQQAQSYDVNHPENAELRALINAERVRLAGLQQAAQQRHDAEVAAAQERERQEKEAEKKAGTALIIGALVVLAVIIFVFVKFIWPMLVSFGSFVAGILPTVIIVAIIIFIIYKWLSS